MYPYIVRTYLVSYCPSVRQQQRFNDPTLKPRSVFFGGCIKNSSVSSKHVHCCIHASRDHVSREHSTAAVGFHIGSRPHKRNFSGPKWVSPEKQSRPAHGWKGRPRNWQRSARWYQVHTCSVSRIEFGSIDPNGRLIMSDSINEAAGTPSVSLAVVVTRTTLSTTLSMRQQLRPPFRWPQLSHARCCSCHRHVAVRVCFQKVCM